ncbi:MAG: metalloregulator ArsR/SmtB family transcription factor [Anaerolineae bacterium]
MGSRQQAGILELLKALADDSRLTMLRLLNEREYSVGELAARVELGEPTVSHHLARLREVGLVTLRMAGNQRFYQLHAGGLARFKQLMSTLEQMPAAPEFVESDDRWIEALGWSADDQEVLKKYTQNGRITSLPSRQKQTLVLLRWLATKFQPDTLYTELQVNAIIKAVYEHDFVSLRRDLVDFGYLRRERGGGKYWLAPSESEGEAAQK